MRGAAGNEVTFCSKACSLFGELSVLSEACECHGQFVVFSEFRVLEIEKFKTWEKSDWCRG